MKAASGPLPREPGWAFEIKWDGIRTLATVESGALRLRSSTDKPLDSRFPEIAALDLGLPDGTVLDAEIVGFADGVVSFGALASGRATTALVVFDLLRVGRLDVWALPWTERRRALEQLVTADRRRTVSAVYDDVDALWNHVRDRRLEGVMSKRVDAPYSPGRRSPSWRKTKLLHRQEFVVVGATIGTGARRATFGALILAVNVGSELRWVGNVGTGFNEQALAEWSAHIDAAATTAPPITPSGTLSSARWVEPSAVLEVEFSSWTDGGHLRHPVAVGRRHDVDPSGVVREQQ